MCGLSRPTGARPIVDARRRYRTRKTFSTAIQDRQPGRLAPFFFRGRGRTGTSLRAYRKGGPQGVSAGLPESSAREECGVSASSGFVGSAWAGHGSAGAAGRPVPAGSGRGLQRLPQRAGRRNQGLGPGPATRRPVTVPVGRQLGGRPPWALAWEGPAAHRGWMEAGWMSVGGRCTHSGEPWAGVLTFFLCAFGAGASGLHGRR